MLDTIIEKCINKKCKYKTLKNTSRIVINKSLKRKHNKLNKNKYKLQCGGEVKVPKAPKAKPSKLGSVKAGILSSLGSKSASTKQKLNMNTTTLKKKIVNKNKTSTKVLRGIFKYTIKKPLKLGLLPATIPAKYAIKKVIKAKRYLFGSTKDLEKIGNKIDSVDAYINKLQTMKLKANTDSEKAALTKEIDKQHSLRDKLNAESISIYNKKDSTIGRDLINFTRKVKYGFTDGGDIFKRYFKNAGWRLFGQRNRVANNLEKSAEKIEARISAIKDGTAYLKLTEEEKTKKIAKLNDMKKDLIRSARYNRQVGQELKTGSVFTYFTKSAERGDIRNRGSDLLKKNAKTEDEKIKAVLATCPNIKKSLKSMNIPVDDISKLGENQKLQLIKLYNTVLNTDTGLKDASKIENIRRNFIYGMIKSKASNNLSAETFKRHKVNTVTGSKINTGDAIKPDEPGVQKLNYNGSTKPEYKSSTQRFKEYYDTLPYNFSNNNIAKIKSKFKINKDDYMFKNITKPNDINIDKIPMQHKIKGALIKNEFEIYKLQQLLNDNKINDPGIYINIKRKISELQDEQKKMKSRDDEINKKLQDKHKNLAHLTGVRNKFKSVTGADNTPTYTYPKIKIVKGKVFVIGTKTSTSGDEYTKSLNLINNMIARKTDELDTITKTQNTQLNLVAKGRINNANTLKAFNNDSRRSIRETIIQLQQPNTNIINKLTNNVNTKRTILLDALNEPDPNIKRELVKKLKTLNISKNDNIKKINYLKTILDTKKKIVTEKKTLENNIATSKEKINIHKNDIKQKTAFLLGLSNISSFQNLNTESPLYKQTKSITGVTTKSSSTNTPNKLDIYSNYINKNRDLINKILNESTDLGLNELKTRLTTASYVANNDDINKIKEIFTKSVDTNNRRVSLLESSIQRTNSKLTEIEQKLKNHDNILLNISQTTTSNN